MEIPKSTLRQQEKTIKTLSLRFLLKKFRCPAFWIRFPSPGQELTALLIENHRKLSFLRSCRSINGTIPISLPRKQKLKHQSPFVLLLTLPIPSRQSSSPEEKAASGFPFLSTFSNYLFLLQWFRNQQSRKIFLKKAWCKKKNPITINRVHP